MTVSQVWAFCPPPCRNITCGESVPHFSALMSPESMRSTGGSGPVCPICSAFSGSRANSWRPINSSSLTTNWTLPTAICAHAVAITATTCAQAAGRLALDEGFELRARDVVGHLLGRALHQVGRSGDDGAADSTIQCDLRRADRVDDDASRVRRVPHLELVLEVQRHVAEGAALEPDVGPLAVVEPADVIGRADVHVLGVELALQVRRDGLGLGDLLRLEA